MAENTFNTPAGQTIKRELLIAYLNVGTASAPVWAALGTRVEDSSESIDWGKETKQDILGNTFTTMKKPVLTQPFDPMPLDADDAAAQKIWTLGIHDQDAQALANQDMMIAHFYYGTGSSNFAERYSSCAIDVTGIGGDGGGVLTMSTEVTYGGTRTIGTATKGSDGSVTFAAAA